MARFRSPWRASRRAVVSVPLETVNGSKGCALGGGGRSVFGGAGALRLATRRRACSSVASGSLLCQLDERERRRVARACLRAFSGCVAVRARRLTPRTGTPTVLWRSFCTGPISLPSDAGASIDEGDRVVKANHEQRAGLDTRRTEQRDGGGPVLRRARSRGRVTKRAITAGGAPSVRSTRPSRLVAGRPRRRLRCPVIRRWRGSRR